MVYGAVESATPKVKAFVAVYAKSSSKGDRFSLNLLIAVQIPRVREIASLFVK
jgi:hypothetical protein